MSVSDGIIDINNGALLSSIEKLYLCTRTADVYFVCENNLQSYKRVPAHKNILAASSDVFTAMFYGELKEKGDINLEGVSVQAFEEFLQFFYLGEVRPTEENIAEILHLGHKYNVVRCFSECVQFFKKNINENNSCFVLGLAILYDQKELLKLCEKNIISCTSECFKSADFLKCEKRVLEHILKMDLLSCSECEVFEACMSWVKAQSKRAFLSKKVVKEYLGDLFYEIRFTSMTLEELTRLTVPYDAILSDDFKDIAKMITFPDFQSKMFKRNRRNEIHWNPNDVIICDRMSNERYEHNVYLRVANIIEFSSNAPVVLGGFVCARVSIFENGQYENLKSNLSVYVSITELEIVSNDFESSDSGSENELDNEPLMKFKASLRRSKETSISLPKPILIRNAFDYRIRIEYFPENHYFHAKKVESQVQINSDITIDFYDNGSSGEGFVTALKLNLI